MGVEHHAYGTVLGGLLTRRVFILYFCGIAAIVSCVQLSSFVYSYYADGGLEASSKLEAAACTGTMQCYEVWSCHGWKDATEHLREPFLQALSLLASLSGFLGAWHGDRFQLLTAGAGMLLLGVVCVVVAAFDNFYTEVCGAYPTSVVDAMLSRRMPPSPLPGGIQEQLRAQVVYPVGQVDALTQNFKVLTWYTAYLGTWGVFNLYAGYQARLLSNLVDKGPLGLGVNYGMHQWDEFINHDALRRHCQKLEGSDFLEDANEPLPYMGKTTADYGAARRAPVVDQPKFRGYLPM